MESPSATGEHNAEQARICGKEILLWQVLASLGVAGTVREVTTAWRGRLFSEQFMDERTTNAKDCYLPHELTLQLTNAMVTHKGPRTNNQHADEQQPTAQHHAESQIAKEILWSTA